MKEELIKMLKERYPNLSDGEINLIGIFVAKTEKHYKVMYTKRIIDAVFKPDQDTILKDTLIGALTIIIRLLDDNEHPEDYAWACTVYKNITGKEPEELFK